MHYQHRFHAGNFADVHKHVVLCALLRALCRKDAPWAYLETHAGGGAYDLRDDAAVRTAEFHDGIGRLYGAAGAPPAVAAYLDIVRTVNAHADLRRYPGSPLFAAHHARAADRILLCEREPAIAANLKAELGADPHVAVHQRDGYEAHSLLPPREKRGLVLVDPPYERPDEFDAVAEFVARALARFGNGVIAIWYPYKKRFDTERFLRRLRRDCPREAVNYVLETGAASIGQMHACGVLVINPPFSFVGEIAAALPWLADMLAQGSKAQARAEHWAIGKS
ncbi:MAG TPA: 23S rRNA (adenine(2030)-N(6))-methyltransferase RlmJ [Solimonas sp.]|nr:23S rRNA (adenine(2030)-N(6))-methyltransferase RlmJ [Solimonas sp.]